MRFQLKGPAVQAAPSRAQNGTGAMTTSDGQLRVDDAVHRAVATNPTGLGLFLDFDGTLTPFVGASERIALTEDLLAAVSALSTSLGAVAVVSGRPLPFLVSAFPDPAIQLGGVYGLESRVDGKVGDAPGVDEWLSTLGAVRDELRPQLCALPGAALKDKRVSVVVHWTGGPAAVDVGDAIAHMMSTLATQTGLRLLPGKSAYELVPPVPVDKGEFVRRLTRQTALTTIVCIGDDVGDLAAFEAAHEIGGLAIAVDDGVDGYRRTPEVVLAAADDVLRGPSAVARWLLDLSRAVGDHHGRE